MQQLGQDYYYIAENICIWTMYTLFHLDYLIEELQKDGLENVHGENVTVSSNTYYM